jgi:methyl-galactoside transport system substrate-binding protein
VIFCTSDIITISAVFVLHVNERTAVQDIYLVGIDGIPMVLNYITYGWATGTVFNNYVEQAEHAVNAAINYVNGEDNEHYIECGYTKITAENAEEFMELSNRVFD